MNDKDRKSVRELIGLGPEPPKESKAWMDSDGNLYAVPNED